VLNSYAVVTAKNLKKIAFELRQRGAKKISIWDPDSRLEKEKINWNELNCRLLTRKNGGSAITESIRKMARSQVNPQDVSTDILDQFIGPCGEEPDILICCGAKELVTTAGYPPWALRLTSMYCLPSPFSTSQINEILFKFSSVEQRVGR